MTGEYLLGLLQFSDGLFPAGSYAHSFGLETYAAEHSIKDASGVHSFLLSYLRGSVAPTDVVAALAACRAAFSPRAAALTECIRIDRALDAMKPAKELREASRQMGRQVLRIAADLGGKCASGGLTADLFQAIESADMPGHHATAFGLIGAAIECPEMDLARAYLYATCSGLIAASLRLLPMGQTAGQRVLWAMAPVIEELAAEVQGKEMNDIWSFAPAMEISSMRHAMLDARLFRS